MARVFLNTFVDLHSPSTVQSSRGQSVHVYLSSILLDAVEVELIIMMSVTQGPLLPEGSRVRAVGRAFRFGDVIIARNPTLSLDDGAGQPASLVAPMLELAISNDPEIRRIHRIGGVFDAKNVVQLPGPILLPGQTRLAGFELPEMKVPADPYINSVLNGDIAERTVGRELDIMRLMLKESS